MTVKWHTVLHLAGKRYSWTAVMKFVRMSNLNASIPAWGALNPPENWTRGFLLHDSCHLTSNLQSDAVYITGCAKTPYTPHKYLTGYDRRFNYYTDGDNNLYRLFVLKVINIKITVVWVVPPCNLVKYRHSTLNMEESGMAWKNSRVTIYRKTDG